MTNSEQIAIMWEQGLREAKKSDAEVRGAIKSIHRCGDTVTVTFRRRKEAKPLDKTTDSDHHRETARPGAAQKKDHDMATKKSTKKTTKRVTAKKPAKGSAPRNAKKATAKKATAKKATARKRAPKKTTTES